MTTKALTPLEGVLKRVPAYFPFTGVSTLQIVFLFFLQEHNLSQGTYTPQVSDRLRGGTEKSTRQASIKENPGLFPVYRG